MDLNELTFDDVKTLADSIVGFKYHPSSKEETLKKKLSEYIESHPECIETEDGENLKGREIPEEDKIPTLGTNPIPENKPPEDKKQTGKVKIQSKYRGVIASSCGTVDFGEDGLVEVTPEQAELFLSLEGYDKC